jgi:hypothetical protein
VTKKKAINLVVIVAMAAALFGIISNNIPILGSFRFIWGPGTALLLLMIKPTLVFNSPLKMLLIYGILVIFLLPRVLWSQMDEWNLSSQIEEFISLVFAFIVIGYYLKTKNRQGLATIAQYGFFFILTSVLITHLVLFLDGSIVRDSAAVFNENEARLNLAERTGAIGYGYAQGVTFIFPILVFALKNKLKLFWSKRVTFVILIIFLLLIIRAQVFSNIIVGFIVILLAFLGSKKNYLTYSLIGFIVLLLYIIPVEIYADALRETSGFFDSNSETYGKINDFADFMINPDTDNEDLSASNRARRYPMLLSCLVENPIFGTFSSYKTDYQEEGAHLYFMNRLAIWGIPVFLFFIYVLNNLIQQIRKVFNNEFNYYYFLSVLAFILYGLSKNIAGREPFIILFIIIPGLYFLLQRNNPKYFKNSTKK